MTIKDKSLVVQANHVIEARYRLSLEEQRLIKVLISKIEPGDEDNKIYRLKATDIAELFEVTDDHIYHTLRQVTAKLLKQVLFIKREGSELQVNWLSSAEYLSGGIIELEISQKLRPYLLQLKEYFTKYQLRNIAKLKSSFSIRVYELCKCHEYKGGFLINVDDLKKMFGIESKYKLYGDLKRYVLMIAKNEINESTDLTIDLVEIREGKRVTCIRFLVKAKLEEQITRHQESTKSMINEATNSLVEHLLNLGVTKRTAQKIVKDYDEKRIEVAIAYCESQLKEGKIRNPGGFIVEAIKNEYIDNKAEEKEKKQKAQKAVGDKEKQEKEFKAKQSLQRQDAIDTYLNSLTQDQVIALEAEFVEAHKANAIVIQRYNKEGRKNPIVNGCFEEFVFKRLSQLREANA